MSLAARDRGHAAGSVSDKCHSLEISLSHPDVALQQNSGMRQAARRAPAGSRLAWCVCRGVLDALGTRLENQSSVAASRMALRGSDLGTVSCSRERFE